MVDQIIEQVKALGEPDRIPMYEKYFQCKVGGYGFGDKFLAVRIPSLRKVSKIHKDASLEEIECLLKHEIHEVRLLALFIMVLQFKSKKTYNANKTKIFESYLNNTAFINNWDLVDSSAHYIVGAWCFENQKTEVLFDLANSDYLWNNRISIIATFYFIKQNRFDITFKIAKILLNHSHDIIHKGVGWMLREVGKRDLELEVGFLATHYKNMSRTTLRYAIEKFNESLKLDFMQGKV